MLHGLAAAPFSASSSTSASSSSATASAADPAALPSRELLEGLSHPGRRVLAGAFCSLQLYRPYYTQALYSNKEPHFSKASYDSHAKPKEGGALKFKALVRSRV